MVSVFMVTCPSPTGQSVIELNENKMPVNELLHRIPSLTAVCTERTIMRSDDVCGSVRKLMHASKLEQS